MSWWGRGGLTSLIEDNLSESFRDISVYKANLAKSPLIRFCDTKEGDKPNLFGSHLNRTLPD